MWSSWSSDPLAPPLPSSASCSILLRRERTSANSAATKSAVQRDQDEQGDEGDSGHHARPPIGGLRRRPNRGVARWGPVLEGSSSIIGDGRKASKRQSAPGADAGARPARRSRFASSKSFSVKPPSEWVRDRHLDLAPGDREVGVVVHLLGRLDQRVDELDRAHEVAAVEATSRSHSPSRCQPSSSESLADLLFAQLRHYLLVAQNVPYSMRADRQPSSLRHRDAIRARPRRPGGRRHPRMRLPAGGGIHART